MCGEGFLRFLLEGGEVEHSAVGLTGGASAGIVVVEVVGVGCVSFGASVVGCGGAVVRGRLGAIAGGEEGREASLLG
jgi:hypothetical protein